MAVLKKCIVWDLDNTLWDGVCLEGKVSVKKDIYDTLTELDHRGILHSVASRGDEDLAMKVLKDNKLDEFFLVPKINWLPKSQNILNISKELSLSLDSIAFIDDDEFEREQVSFMIPDVLTIEAEKANILTGLPYFSPEKITMEAKERRNLYRAEMNRKKSKLKYNSREDFLVSCKMKLKVRQMSKDDIPRVLELMTRTHQLNTTGIILDQNELTKNLHTSSGKSNIMIAELEDKFGPYGIIGTAIIETKKPVWKLKYLALSCRVMGRGIERAFLSQMVRSSYNGGFENWEAEFRNTRRNRMMRVLYQMMGFSDCESSDDSETMIFRAKMSKIPEIPKWVEVV